MVWFLFNFLLPKKYWFAIRAPGTLIRRRRQGWESSESQISFVLCERKGARGRIDRLERGYRSFLGLDETYTWLCALPPLMGDSHQLFEKIRPERSPLTKGRDRFTSTEPRKKIPPPKRWLRIYTKKFSSIFCCVFCRLVEFLPKHQEPKRFFCVRWLCQTFLCPLIGDEEEVN